MRSLTVSRLLNAFVVLLSYYLSKWLKRPLMWGSPVSISIEPTTSCNLGCPECPSGLKKFSRPTGNLNQSLAESVFKELKNSLHYVTFYFQGEPYIHPKFLDLVKKAKAQNLYTATSTNAHFLRDKVAKETVESGLDRLIISIDGTSQETYEQYRINGKLDKVIEGTKNILKWKKELNSATPHVIFQFLVVSHNEHQVEEVKKLGADLGVDEVKFKTAQLYDYENGNTLMPKNEKFSRYKKGPDGKFSIKNPLDNQCWRMWQGCVVTWDGLIVPCCFDKDAQHQLGDLKTTTFKEIWKSNLYQNFRGSILKSRKEIDICTNCTEGTKVWEDA
ncbi:MAG: radical SAM/SPASM domain-containing protein [Salibacteraceae bacterium]